MPSVTLPDRAFIAIGGVDAEHFLQGLITTDIAALESGVCMTGALLTPQGKIMFEFLISRAQDGFIAELAADQADAFAKRLAMYKLRAGVTIERLPGNAATVSWDQAIPEGAIADGRFRRAGVALHRWRGASGAADASAYRALRIAHGIAEAGSDFPLQDAFPHDALYDLSGAVSFRKGCYVGQEVVSRMQHRSTARRRVVIVEAGSPLPQPGTALTVNDREIGRLGSVAGNQGLAIARIDRIGEALTQGEDILAGEIAVSVRLPAWSGIEFPAGPGEAEA